MKTHLLALAMLAVAAPLRAETLTSALSTNEVLIGSDFAGDSISLFGVVERDQHTVARSGAYEIIVVVRGPEQAVLVQRRERRFGIWVNGPGEVFNQMPTYYGLFATPGAAHLIEDEGGSARQLSLSALGATGGEQEAHRLAHRVALAQARRSTGLFVEDLDGVQKLSKTFFRTEIPLPSVLDDGEYEVFVFLYAADTPLAPQELPFRVRKTGFEQRVYEWAKTTPLLYGLGTVLLGLITGYVGGVVFRRG